LPKGVSSTLKKKETTPCRGEKDRRGNLSEGETTTEGRKRRVKKDPAGWDFWGGGNAAANLASQLGGPLRKEKVKEDLQSKGKPSQSALVWFGKRTSNRLTKKGAVRGGDVPK